MAHFVEGYDAIKTCEVKGLKPRFLLFYDAYIFELKLPQIVEGQPKKSACRRFHEFVYSGHDTRSRTMLARTPNPSILQTENKDVYIVIRDNGLPAAAVIALLGQTQVLREPFWEVHEAFNARRLEGQQLRDAIEKRAKTKVHFGPAVLWVEPEEDDVEIVAEVDGRTCIKMTIHFAPRMSFVDELNKCATLSGTDVLSVIVDRINMELGVWASALTDGSTIKTNCSSHESYLWWHFARKGQTWYQAHGWQPKPADLSLWDIDFEEDMKELKERSDKALAQWTQEAQAFLDAPVDAARFGPGFAGLPRKVVIEKLLAELPKKKNSAAAPCKLLRILHKDFKDAALQVDMMELVKFY